MMSTGILVFHRTLVGNYWHRVTDQIGSKEEQGAILMSVDFWMLLLFKCLKGNASNGWYGILKVLVWLQNSLHHDKNVCENVSVFAWPWAKSLQLGLESSSSTLTAWLTRCFRNMRMHTHFLLSQSNSACSSSIQAALLFPP